MLLGKTPPTIDPRTLRFSAYVSPFLPPPPNSVDYSKLVSEWPLYGNDVTNDCVCAAAGHMIQCWTANVGAEVVPPDADITAFYKLFSGGNPAVSVNMLSALSTWQSIGVGTDKIRAFAQLELRNHVEAMDTIYIFGNCFIGLALPDFAVAAGVTRFQVPWVVPATGPVGNAAPNPRNGHCVPAVAYDARSLYVVTWGGLKTMSWQFYDAYSDEAYAVLSDDWINKRVGTAPQGFNLAQLERDLNAIA